MKEVSSKTRKQAAVIFLRAAGYIRQNGWQKEGMGEDGQPRCSMGALRSAYPETAWDVQLSALMYDSLNQELNGISLTQFNSRFESGEKVARLFERTARNLDRRTAI